MANEPREAEWFFDFVSPFSYFACRRLRELEPDLSVTLRPVLFAALLRHWGHKGPAEIPAKRRYTYRYCQWYADANGIPFRMPPAHPFVPLRPLRLAIALGATREVVANIFDFIWAEGRDSSDEAGFAALAGRLDVDRPEAVIAEPRVKQALRANTAAAADAGVFGVPTLVVGGELFWGVESLAMARDFAREPGRFAAGELARVADLPIGVERPR